ncbi:MAG: ArdC family protein [Terriglobia bacterium]
MKIEQAKQLSEQAIEKLIETLESGKSEALKAYLAAMSRFRKYSFGNVLLIAFQMPTASYVAGYQTWKALGRFVRTGEKGIAILAPIISKRETAAETRNFQGEQSPVLVGVRPVIVFDYSQTEGDPLPQFTTVKGDPKDYTERLKAYIAQSGITIEYSSDIAPAKGLSEGGKITLQPDLSPAEMFSVLVHEYSHERLHKDARRAETTCTIRETEAEAVAFIVSHAIGLDTNTASADYLTIYNGDKQVLMDSFSYIQQTASQILTAISPGE